VLNMEAKKQSSQNILYINKRTIEIKNKKKKNPYRNTVHVSYNFVYKNINI